MTRRYVSTDIETHIVTHQMMQLVKNAMAWPFVQDGIPILYYGEYTRLMLHA